MRYSQRRNHGACFCAARFFSHRHRSANVLGSSTFCPTLNQKTFRRGSANGLARRYFHESSISAADWSRLKKSSELGFSRRQRCYQANTNKSYKVPKTEIHVSTWRGMPAFTARLISRDGSRNQLSLAIIPLEKGIFRLSVSDFQETRHERHIATGITTDQCRSTPIDDSMLTITDELALVSLPDRTTDISIHLDPFRIDLVSRKSGHVAASINSESRLLVEDFGETSLFDNDQYLKESFGDHEDPQLRGPESVGVDISFPNAEHLHGIPERTSPFSLPPTTLSSGEALSEPYRMYNLDVPYYELNKELGLYGSVPLLYARAGSEATGIFWHNASETYVDVVASRSEPRSSGTHWYSESGVLDLFLLPGPLVKDVFKQYVFLTGPSVLPPMFALGYHQCRYSYEDEADVREVDAGFSSRDIPCDTIWLDIDHTDGKRYFTFDKVKFPDPVGLQKDLSRKGRRSVAIIDPHIKRDDSYGVYTLARKEGLYVSRPDQSEYQGDCWAGQSSYLDFVSPRVRREWGKLFSKAWYPEMTDDLHIWNDMNEPTVFDGPEGTMPKDVLHDNIEHRHVHNLYGHSMARATYEGLLQNRPDQRPFILTRSFFAGTQRFAAVWTGDNEASWEHLRVSVGMVNALQICGFGLSGADVGGFCGDPTGELMVRWYQAGAFQPFFRGHSNKGTRRREPWLFGKTVSECIRKAIYSRYEFMTYWYTLFASLDPDTGMENGGPPMRPVWWEFDGWLDSENMWMAGDGLLVAPVMEPGVDRHKLDVPQGRWYDVYGGLKEVRKTVDTNADLDRMFVLLRGGKVIPMLVSQVRSSVDVNRGEYALLVGLDDDGVSEGTGYFDDGISQRFRNGDRSVMKWRFRNGELVVERAGGEFFSEARLVTINLCGFGQTAPRKVLVADENSVTEVGFNHYAETGVLEIQGIDKSMTQNKWSLKIEK